MITGYLRLTGRYKDLIIRGGENIMPAEVEAAISQLPPIRQAKVLGVPSAFYGEEVAACVRLVPSAVWDEAEIRKALREKLARFKIPAYFIVYDEFPTLGSGKIDGVALREDVMKRIGER